MSLNYYQDENDLFLLRKLIDLIQHPYTEPVTLGTLVNVCTLYSKEQFIKANTLEKLINYFEKDVIKLELIQEGKSLLNGVYIELQRLNTASIYTIGSDGNKKYRNYLQDKLKKYKPFEEETSLTDKALVLDILKDSELIDYYLKNLKVVIKAGVEFTQIENELSDYINNFSTNNLISRYAGGFESNLVRCESQMGYVLRFLSELVYKNDFAANLLSIGHLPSPDKRRIKQGQNYVYPYRYKFQECIYYLERVGFIKILDITPARFVIDASELFSTDPTANEQLSRFREVIQQNRLSFNDVSGYLNHLQESKYKELSQQKLNPSETKQLQSLRQTIYDSEKTIKVAEKGMKVNKRLKEVGTEELSKSYSKSPDSHPAAIFELKYSDNWSCILELLDYRNNKKYKLASPKNEYSPSAKTLKYLFENSHVNSEDYKKEYGEAIGNFSKILTSLRINGNIRKLFFVASKTYIKLRSSITQNDLDQYIKDHKELEDEINRLEHIGPIL